MYGYGYGYYGFDWTYVLLIVGMLLSLAASSRLKSTFSCYRKIRSASGLTGAETAQRILRAAGITDVNVRAISGSLTDHYDPRTKTVSLSEDIYDKTSLAAVGVAAHECGHAIQHAIGYAPLEFRSAIVPVANFGSTLSSVPDRTFCRNPSAGNGRNRAVLTGSAVSACDTSGGDQCVFQGPENAAEYRNSRER